MRQATLQELEALPYWDSRLKLFYTDSSDPFMTEAKLVQDTESTDKGHSTGAVVVKDGVLLGKGANQAGFRHPIFIEWHRRWLCVRRWLGTKSGTKYWLCPGCSTHKEHAESRACAAAIRKHGADKVGGATLYLYGHYWCCKPCSEAMIKAGIANTILVEGATGMFK